MHEVHLGDFSSVKEDLLNVDEADASIYYYDSCPTTDKVRRWILEDVQRQSTPICQMSASKHTGTLLKYKQTHS